MPAPQVEQSDHRACNARNPVVPGARVGGASPTYVCGSAPLVIGDGSCRHVALPSLNVYQVPFRGGDPVWMIVATAMSSKSLSSSITPGGSMIGPESMPPAPPPALPSGTRL